MSKIPDVKRYDIIVIGGGQAGLSVAYFLRRINLDYIILDEKNEAGGSWLNTWDSLKLFSPTSYSSLSGWQMPSNKNEYPTKNEFINYLQAYKERYNFPIQRGTKVNKVFKEDNLFRVETNFGEMVGKTVVSATGTADNPFIPHYPDIAKYQGIQIHSKDYRNPKKLKEKKVLVVGGGNSGAQILAEVSQVANTKWVTLNPSHFLPEDIDGRYLFHQATEKYYNKGAQKSQTKKASLSDIVQIDSVKEALERGVYQDYRPFKSFYSNGVIWDNGEKEQFDVVIWCTGFKPNLTHLRPLGIVENDKVDTKETTVRKMNGLWLVGYGNWTGFASATIYGVGKTAKRTAKEIETYIN